MEDVTQNVASDTAAIINTVYSNPILTIVIILCAISALVIVGCFVIPKISRYFSKIGPVEFAGNGDAAEQAAEVAETHGLSLSRDQVMVLAAQIQGLSERYVKDKTKFRAELVKQQLLKTSMYLEEARNGLILPFSEKVNKVKKLKETKDIPINDLADLLQLFLERDFNLIIYQQIENYVSSKVMAEENDKSLQQEISRIAKSSTQNLKTKFLHYPSIIDHEILSEIFNANEDSISDAIRDALQEAKQLSEANREREQSLRKEYDMEINNAISQIMGVAK